MADHLFGQAGIDADEKGVGGNHVTVGQRPDNAMLDVGVGGMPQEVSTKQVAGLDAGGFERIDQLGSRERRLRPDGDDVSEPRGIGLGRRGMQDQMALVFLEAGFERGVVALSRGNEFVQFLQLRHADGRLHVGHLEIVADMRVHVLVVVAKGQRAKLLGKTLAAGIVLAAGAIAIPPPIPETPGDAREVFVRHRHRPAFPHRDVVGWVKAKGGQVAESCREPVLIAAAQGVTIVLDQP